MKKIFFSLILAAIFFLSLLGPASAQTDALFSQGSVIFGADTTLTCSGTYEGVIRFNPAHLKPEFCNGTSWNAFTNSSGSGPPATTISGTGYLVIKSTAGNGDMYTTGFALDATVTTGLEGANAICLDHLTNNTWLGKATAQANGWLDSDHVQAMLCDHSACQLPYPSTTYAFASTGNATYGGNTFTADAIMQGPGDSNNWMDTTNLGTSAAYWTGMSTGAATLWSPTPTTNSTCVNWTSSNSGQTGYYGSGNNTGTARWRNTSSTCDINRRMLCLVHPWPP